MKFLNKIKFIFRKPKAVIVVLGRGRKTTREAIFQVLKPHFKMGKEILITENLIPAQTRILVITHFGEYHPEKEFFAAEFEQVQRSQTMAKHLSTKDSCILNFDDETVRDIKTKTLAHPFSFGFGWKADFRASDIVLTRHPWLGINFKINYQGKIVPVWLKNLFGKENIYASLCAAAVGISLNLNLVEISESLKSYGGIPGRMKLIEGIKRSWILDDSENATSLSMLEALKILSKIKTGRRKIAVLGDILGIGKYSIEAHESLGEEVGQVADVLFTVGPRAKFLAKGAIKRGVPEHKIFQFDEAVPAGKALQEEIQKGDLILVDGSKEMSMIEVVKEIKA